MFAKNIRFLRNKYGLTQRDLAERVGLKPTTISKWETGDNKPRFKETQILTRIFNVSENDLFHADLSEPKPVESSHSIRIKVYGSVPAGIPLEAIEDIVGWEDIPKEWTTGGREYFALKVRGDSMSPKYLNGDTIICRKQSDCESGQDCVVYVNGYDATLKKVVKGNGVIVLQPINPLYETKVYTDDIHIAGAVVEIRRIV